MRARKKIAAGLLAGLLLLAGCQGPFMAVPNPSLVDVREYGRMFNAAVEVLRSQGFIVDREDYRFGKVTARPRVSPSMAEMWYGDNTTGYQALESTLNYQRRFVTIWLRPRTPAEAGKPADTYELSAEVLIEQLDDPKRFLTGSYVGTRVWNELSEVPAEYQERGIKGAYWEPIGRDSYMEQRLIADILRRSVTMGENPVSQDNK